MRGQVAAGVDVNHADTNRWRALHEAARGGHLEVLKELVGAGADVWAVTGKGASALCEAIQAHGPTHEAALYLHDIGVPYLGCEQ